MLDTALHVADTASRQSDRYLFVALLVLVLLACAWLVRSLSTRLTAITDRHITQSENLATVVANNTAVMAEVKATLQNCKLKNLS